MVAGQFPQFPWALFPTNNPWGENVQAPGDQYAWPLVTGTYMLQSEDFHDTDPPEWAIVSPEDHGGDAGEICFMFTADYYERIYITPNDIGLGNLVSAQFRQFDVWNAYFSSKLLSSLVPSGDTTGIILTEPDPAPTTFGALEVRTYDLNFALTGPATIDVTWTFNFPDESPTLEVTGNRVIIFALPPDWSEEVTEKYEWLTHIIETEDGFEDRYRLRINPRRSLEYRLLKDGVEKRWLERYLYAWKGRPFSVPIWTDCAITTTPTIVGDSTIDIATTDYTSFKVGGIAIFFNGYDDTEAVEIQNVNPTSLDLVRPTLQAWPAGTKFYPARVGRMRDDVTLSQPTAGIDIGRIRFEFVDPDEAIPAVDAGPIFYDSRVMERAPNRAEDISVIWQSRYGLVDFGIGQPLVDDRAGFPDQVYSLSFAEDTRADIWFWKEWMHERAGKWSKFYMSSWSTDFVLVAPIAFNDVSLDVEDIEYRTFYDGVVEKQNITIKTSDGQLYHRRITSVSLLGPGVERFTIDAVLGISYSIDEVLMISFLHPVRLDTDSVEFNWDTAEVARVNFNTRVIGQ